MIIVAAANDITLDVFRRNSGASSVRLVLESGAVKTDWINRGGYGNLNMWSNWTRRNVANYLPETFRNLTPCGHLPRGIRSNGEPPMAYRPFYDRPPHPYFDTQAADIGDLDLEGPAES